MEVGHLVQYYSLAEEEEKEEKEEVEEVKKRREADRAEDSTLCQLQHK